MDILPVYINDLEEWEMLKDAYALNLFFQKAQSMIVGGGKVQLIRRQFDRSEVVIEEIDELEGLEKIKEKYWRYFS